MNDTPRRWVAAGAAVGAGFSAAASQPPIGAWPLVFVAPALLLAAVAIEVHAATLAGTRPRVFRWGLLAGVARFAPLLSWLVFPAGAVGYVLLVLLQSAFMGLFAVLARPWVRSRWVVPVAAVLWTGLEAWRGSVPLGGFDWGALSYAHVQGSWLLPLARLVGGRGLTFLTVFIAAALFDVGRRMHAATLGLRGRYRDHLQAGLPHAQPALVLLAGALLVGTLATVEPPAPTGRTANVLVVQGNDIVDRAARTGGRADRVIAANMRTLTRAAVDAGGQPDLTVWPESAVDRDPYTLTGADLRDDVLAAAQVVGGNLLFGASLDGPTPTSWRNAAVLTDAAGLPVARYAKRHLVPFGEYVPGRSLLGWFAPLRQIPFDAIPGAGPQTIVTSGGVRLAVAICYETLFPDLVRDNVTDGGQPAELIVASTNDASVRRLRRTGPAPRPEPAARRRERTVGGACGPERLLRVRRPERTGARRHRPVRAGHHPSARAARRGTYAVPHDRQRRRDGDAAARRARHGHVDPRCRASASTADDARACRRTCHPPPGVPRMSRTLVVIPTYNERASIREVVTRTLASPAVPDVLVVDDNSPDGTGAIVDELATDQPRLHVLHRPGKQGLGQAYRVGLGWGIERGYDVLVEMDADLSHDPDQLADLVAATDRADLAIGSRYVPGGRIENWPPHRYWLSSGGNRYVRLATGLPVHDATSGYRAFRRETLEALELPRMDSDGYSFQLETVLKAWRLGFRIEEVPITFVERRAGTSKINRGIVIEALWRVLVWGLKGPRSPGRRHPASVQADGA